VTTIRADHEIDVDALHTIKELKERIWLLEEAVHELLIYASPFAKEAAARCKDGYTSELVPRFTRIGSVKVDERIAQIRALVTLTNDVTEKDEV